MQVPTLKTDNEMMLVIDCSDKIKDWVDGSLCVWNVKSLKRFGKWGWEPYGNETVEEIIAGNKSKPCKDCIRGGDSFWNIDSLEYDLHGRGCFRDMTVDPLELNFFSPAILSVPSTSRIDLLDANFNSFNALK